MRSGSIRRRGTRSGAILISSPLTCLDVGGLIFSHSLVAGVRGGIMDSMRWLRVGGVLVGAGLLLSGTGLFAQHGGGAGMGGGAPVSGMSRPGGVEDKDDLKGFHRAMAVQATSEQIAQFQEVVKKTEAARGALDQLVSGLDSHASAKSADEWGSQVVAVREALDGARGGTGKFVGALSLEQKTGLKEITAKLMKAESELG